ncbi:ROK family transcriptional regulator [Nocardia terpenica]|uniref:Sugar kinase n=1 Tax=Nocardia terpenica TaxID=455432 RepID=A0A164JN77_9NOCA|nr:ROK family transcriptional regulator [Nocardia terpenica]KZM70564.1 sugar kinase [Nocardia terpenica]NQE90196.1 ROK family transcriptional regulator [Nocardia terpenica]
MGQPGKPRLLRTMNERLLLEHLRVDGPASRGDLAKASGLSKPTVSAALAGLQEAGLVHLVGSLSGRPGPTTAIYDVNVRAGLVAGIDIGRKWIRIAIADLRGGFIGRREVRNSARSAADLVRRVRALADEVAAEAGIEWAAVTFAVVGSPGVLDRETGRLVYAPNLPGWGRAGLADRLRAALEVDSAIENDINLAAVGELAFGAGAGVRNFVLISVGTGVGMGIVINGELYVGSSGAAGEVSFLPATEVDAVPAAARHRGFTETVAAAGGVARSAQRAGLTGSAEEIFAAAAAGDPRAREVVTAEGRRIGALVTAVAAILDPELVVLGGGIGRNLDLLGEALAARMAELGPLRPRVVASALGDDGVLTGAVSRALDVARDRLFERRGAGIIG